MNVSMSTARDGRKLAVASFDRESDEAGAPRIVVTCQVLSPDDFRLSGEAFAVIPISVTTEDTREPIAMTVEEQFQALRAITSYVAARYEGLD